MTEEKEKKCPLLMLGYLAGQREYAGDVECRKEGCAWWDEQLRVCVVNHLLNLEYIERSVRK